MRNFRTTGQLLLLVALVICGNAAVRGLEFVAAAGQTYYLDLDTKEGAFSEWRQDDLGATTALRATVSIPRIGSDPKCLPGFLILLRGGGQSHDSDIGVQIVAPQGSSTMTVKVVQGTPDGTFGEKSQVTNTLGLNEKIDIAMDWSTPGIVTIKVGANSYTLKTSSPIERMQITASTGEMKVDPLTMGTVKH